MKNGMAIMFLYLLSTQAQADWATAPDLTSSTLWQMVIEDRAEVVSSVSFGDPTGIHVTQTVFKISKTLETDKSINWAVRKNHIAPVMCSEKWKNYRYIGSSCSIPGVLNPKDLTMAK
jgi:hypothetical protein